GNAGFRRALRIRRGGGVPVHASMPGDLPADTARSESVPDLDRRLGIAADGNVASAAAARIVAASDHVSAYGFRSAGDDRLLPRSRACVESHCDDRTRSCLCTLQIVSKRHEISGMPTFNPATSLETGLSVRFRDEAQTATGSSAPQSIGTGSANGVVVARD